MVTLYKNKSRSSAQFAAKLLCVLLACVSSLQLQSMYNSNFFRPQDVAFLPVSELGARKFIAGAFVEYGLASTQGYDGDGKLTDLFKIYTPHQSSQSMLSDSVIMFPEAEDPEQWFVNSAQQTFNDSWGTFNVSGKFQQSNVTFWLKGAIPAPESVPGIFSVSAYLPVKAIHIDDIAWTDLSNKYTLGGEERMSGFTSRLQDFVTSVGGLDLHRCNRVGQGDLTVMLDWENTFKQDLDLIKQIKLEAGVGVLVPTARTTDSDINQIFAVPLGSGSAWGIPAKASLEAGVHSMASVGFAVDMLWLSDITKARRLKTAVDQTDYLLLSKGRVRHQHARTWRFSLFSRIKSPIEGLSLAAFYHFVKTGDDTLVPENNTFSNAVINSQEALKEKSSHDLVFRASFARENIGWFTAPAISGFIKIPVGGCRMAKSLNWGGEFGFAF